MASHEKWMTIKIPRDLKTEFDKRANGFDNFDQFARYALRKELERLEMQT